MEEIIVKKKSEGKEEREVIEIKIVEDRNGRIEMKSKVFDEDIDKKKIRIVVRKGVDIDGEKIEIIEEILEMKIVEGWNLIEEGRKKC